MNLIAVTQRVVVDPRTGERRDALDQRWAALLLACGFAPILIPNHLPAAQQLFEDLPIGGVLLTGGNDLGTYGGDAPERDATESFLLDAAMRHSLPVLGVCRGMQMIQHVHGVPLQRVEGHVAVRLPLEFQGRACTVNSYHNFGATTTVPDLEVLARSADGVIKAVRQRTARVTGIMWHPEREEPFVPGDLDLLRTSLSAEVQE